jgi:DNA-binding transcriptional MocR family regulator
MYCYNPWSVTLQSYWNGRTSAAIAGSVEQAIRRGELVAGELLPPIRLVASELGVSAGTVAAAYKLLAARGLTTADRRKGTRVRGLRKEHDAGSRRVIPVPAGVTDCSTGNPDPALLPNPIPLLANLDYQPARYGSGVAWLAFVEEANRRFLADGIDADATTVTSGALDAISRILTSNLARGDRVAIEDPGWASLIDVVDRLGFVVVPMEIDEEGPTAEGTWRALAAGAQAVVVTARAHNPTGASVSADRAAELHGVFARYPGRLVIEDDHACGLVETPLDTVVGPTGRYAAVRSIAKGYGPDLRLAAIAGDAATIARLDASTLSGAGWVSFLIQQLALALWQSEETEALLATASQTYRARRQALCRELSKWGIDVSARTGLNVWVPVDDEATAVSTLLAQGWLVAPGGMFRIASPSAVRVTTAALPIERAAECAEALAAAVEAAGSKGRRSAAGG